MDSQLTTENVEFTSDDEETDIFPALNADPWTPNKPTSVEDDKPSLDISFTKKTPPRVAQITIKDNNDDIGTVTVTALAPKKFMTPEELSELSLEENDDDTYVVTVLDDEPLPEDGIINLDVPYMINSITITLMDEVTNEEVSSEETYSVNVDVKACEEGIY